MANDRICGTVVLPCLAQYRMITISSVGWEGTTVWIAGLTIHLKETTLLFVSLFLQKKNKRKIDDFYGLSFRTSPSALPGISVEFEASSQGWRQ